MALDNFGKDNLTICKFINWSIVMNFTTKKINKNYTSFNLIPFFSAFLILLISLFVYSCSKNSEDKQNNSGNSTDTDGGVSLIIASIGNCVTQINSLPRATRRLDKIDTQPLVSREDLAGKTLRELNELNSRLTSEKAKDINSKFQELLKQWSGAVADYKNKLQDYESIKNEIEKTKNAPQDKNLSDRMFKNLEIESRLSKKTSEVYAASSKVEEFEQKIRYFTKEYETPNI